MCDEGVKKITHDLAVTGIIGSGCFGSVFKGISSNAGKDFSVAIKQIKIENKAAYIRSACREVRILSKASHPNVIKLHRVLRKGVHLFMVTDLCFGDLSSIIKSDRLYFKMKTDDILMIAFQTLSGLEYLHSMGIVHRDLKPANLMIDFDMTVKIGDFGSARSIGSSFVQGSKGMMDNIGTEVNAFTDYVVTRWYRAPEIICTSGNYGLAQDIWAAGCIIAELLNRKPLLPGSTSIDQMDLIFQAFGTPSRQDLDFGIDPDAAVWILSKEPIVSQSGLNSMINPSWLTQNIHEEIISLLEKMLLFNPRKRINCKAALESSLFVELQSRMQSQLTSAADKLSEVIHLKDIEMCLNSRTQLMTILNAELKKSQKTYELSGRKGVVHASVDSPVSLQQPPSVTDLSPSESRPLSGSASSMAMDDIASGDLLSDQHATKLQPKSRESKPDCISVPGVASRVWSMFFSAVSPKEPKLLDHPLSQMDGVEGSYSDVFNGSADEEDKRVDLKIKYKARTPQTARMLVDGYHGGAGGVDF